MNLHYVWRNCWCRGVTVDSDCEIFLFTYYIYKLHNPVSWFYDDINSSTILWTNGNVVITPVKWLWMNNEDCTISIAHVFCPTVNNLLSLVLINRLGAAYLVCMSRKYIFKSPIYIKFSEVLVNFPFAPHPWFGFRFPLWTPSVFRIRNSLSGLLYARLQTGQTTSSAVSAFVFRSWT